MFKKKEDLVVIILGTVLVIIVSIISVITANYSRSSTPTSEEPVHEIENNPTAMPIKKSTIQDITKTRPPLLYDKASDDLMLDLIKNRRPIANADKLAKAKILTLLPQGNLSGIVHETRNIRIEYIHAADLFQVEILTTDLKTAKDEANVWLREQGLSQEAICTLPVTFYVNFDIANQLRNTDIVVSSLGNGCI